MASKMRPGAERDTLGQQAAGVRRGAPGKRFVGERAAQSRQAKREEVARVVRMAEEDARERDHERRFEELKQESVAQIVVELVVDSYRLARTFALAPIRILNALRRSRTAGQA